MLPFQEGEDFSYYPPASIRCDVETSFMKDNSVRKQKLAILEQEVTTLRRKIAAFDPDFIHPKRTKGDPFIKKGELTNFCKKKKSFGT